MISRLSAGLGAAILGLASGAAHAQGCIGPGPCPGGYAPASPAYVFQPGPTAAYQAQPSYGAQPGYPTGSAYPGPGDLAAYPGYPPAAQSYDRYGGEYAHAPQPAPYGYQGEGQGGAYPSLPPAPYARQPYGYVPAYGRGVYADRPFTGPGLGYDARECGGGCTPPAQAYAPPAFQPCASPCGYAAPQPYAAPPTPVAYQAPVADVSISDGFLYGLSGGSGGYPEGGGGGGGFNSQGFGFDNGFGISAVNGFFNGFSSANAYANASAASNVNVNVNNQAYANAYANAYAQANAKAVNKNYAMPVYMPKAHPMGPHGCNCAHHAGGHR